MDAIAKCRLQGLPHTLHVHLAGLGFQDLVSDADNGTCHVLAPDTIKERFRGVGYLPQIRHQIHEPPCRRFHELVRSIPWAPFN